VSGIKSRRSSEEAKNTFSCRLIFTPSPLVLTAQPLIQNPGRFRQTQADSCFQLLLSPPTTASLRKGRVVSACLARLRAQPTTRTYLSRAARARDTTAAARGHRRAMSTMRAQELPAFLTQSKAGGYIESTLLWQTLANTPRRCSRQIHRS
jgi:hypothetical protein